MTRADAEDETVAAQIARTNFVYLSGGKPRYLLETLAGSACWEAIRAVFARGGVVAGCSAGAMVLVGEMFDFPLRLGTVPALGLVPGLIVIPHYGEFPIDPSALISRVVGDSTVVGIEGTTALVGSNREWTVLGPGGVTVMAHGGHTRYVAGQRVPLGIA
jgi:cyanophycinase